MRMRLHLVCMALAAMLSGTAWAQGTPPGTRASEAPPNPQAADLPGYVSALQAAEQRLRQARDAAARAPAESQQGAMPAERMELMHATRYAWRTAQGAPPGFEETPAYQEADRNLRQDFGEVGPQQPLDRQAGIAAADSALRTLAELRRKAAEAAGRTGADPAATGSPAPAAQGAGMRR
jgi:hypothetical protein